MTHITKKLLAATIAVLMSATLAQAGVKIIGTGDKMEFDTTGFPPDIVTGYKVMQAKCKKCHSMERTVVAVQTGLGPISNEIFDKSSTEAYGIKMLRKPDSDMNKDEVKTVIAVLNYLLDQASK